MTTPLIEAIARKQCEQHIREVRRWDTDPAKLEAMLPGAVDVNWQDHVALAQAALTAITEAGYAVVPSNPDLDTMLGMMKAANEADCGDLTITSARAALAYLISAAQGDGA